MPHRWGGSDRRGIDCSGLVQRAYTEVYGLVIPRTTREQARVGRTIPPRALRAGDLVFFRIGGGRHVGIYLGNGRFFHASKSRGVVLSDLHDRYWRDHYWKSVRILEAGGARYARR